MAEQPPPADIPPAPSTEPAASPAPALAPDAIAAPAPQATAAPDAAPATSAAPAAADSAPTPDAVPAAVPIAEAPPAAEAAAPAADAQSVEDAGVSLESIEALLKEANFESPDASEGADAAKELSVEQLLQQANFDGGAAVPGAEAEAFKLPSFQQVMADAQVSSIDLLRDVELNVKIELGRSRMLVDDVLKLAEGSVVELDKLAGDPVDVYVNDRLIARGEVLVLNDNFCVRVNEIVPAAKEEGM
jgi:flagellar motor switch protein FliN